MSKLDELCAKTKELIEKYSRVCLFVVFLVFLISRLLRLSRLPYGVNCDEIAMALDAKYLSLYGMDRHLDHLPVYFKNYGGGMSALYPYVLALLYKVFPYSIRLIRMPAVIFGCICFIYSYKLIDELFDNKVCALLGPVFVTIMPFFMSSERWGLDCNLFLSMSAGLIYHFIRAIKTGEIKYYLISGIWMGVTLYTYIISYPVIILFILFSLAYVLAIKKFEIKKVVIMGIPVFVLALPLILFQLVNLEIIPEFTFLFSDFHKLSFYRGTEFQLINIVKNIPFLAVLLLGGDGLNYNAFDIIAFGTVYIFMVPFIVAGLIMMVVAVFKRAKMVKVVKEAGADTENQIDRFDPFVIVLTFFLAAFILVLLIEAPSINKCNEIYMPFMIFAVYAVVNIGKKWRVFVPGFLAVCAIFFLIYSKFYFMDQKDYYGHHTLFYGTPCYDIVTYTEEHYNPTGEKMVYIEQEYEDQGAEVYILSALKADVITPDMFSEDRTEFGNVTLHFPEEYDENEDAVYILGTTWDFIAGYLAGTGYNIDTTFENYLICYRQ